MKIVVFEAEPRVKGASSARKTGIRPFAGADDATTSEHDIGARIRKLLRKMARPVSADDAAF